MADDVSGLSGAAGGAFFTSNAHLFSAAVNATNLSIGRQEARYAFGDTEEKQGAKGAQAEGGGQSLAQWAQLIAEMFPNLSENRIMVMAQQAVNDKDYASRILDYQQNNAPVLNESDVRASTGAAGGEPQDPDADFNSRMDDSRSQQDRALYEQEKIDSEAGRYSGLAPKGPSSIDLLHFGRGTGAQDRMDSAKEKGKNREKDRLIALEEQRASDMDSLGRLGLLDGKSQEQIDSALDEIARRRKIRPVGY